MYYVKFFISCVRSLVVVLIIIIVTSCSDRTSDKTLEFFEAVKNNNLLEIEKLQKRLQCTVI